METCHSKRECNLLIVHFDNNSMGHCTSQLQYIASKGSIQTHVQQNRVSIISKHAIFSRWSLKSNHNEHNHNPAIQFLRQLLGFSSTRAGADRIHAVGNLWQLKFWYMKRIQGPQKKVKGDSAQVHCVTPSSWTQTGLENPNHETEHAFIMLWSWR